MQLDIQKFKKGTQQKLYTLYKNQLVMDLKFMSKIKKTLLKIRNCQSVEEKFLCLTWKV